MRYPILIALAIATITTQALAGEKHNPDGAPGTVWVDLGGNASFDSSYELTGSGVYTSSPEPEQSVNDIRVGLGIVATERITFALGLFREQSTFNQVVPGVGELNQKSQAMSFQVGIRFYLGYGKR